MIIVNPPQLGGLSDQKLELVWSLYQISLQFYSGSLGEVVGKARDLSGVYPLGFVDLKKIKNFCNSNKLGVPLNLLDSYSFPTIRSYHGRILFPFADESGTFIGVIGRTIIKDHKPKYYNSQVTKQNHLFCLDVAKKNILRNDYVLVVEGPVDALRLNKYGIPAVAVLGTTLTDYQLFLVSKYTENILLCFDPDRAGESGVEKILKQSSLYFPTIKKHTLHPKYDPDELLTMFGSEYIKDRVFELLNRLENKKEDEIQGIDEEELLSEEEENIFEDYLDF